eukprot:c38975_g1_i1 orf=534-2075(+)
MANQYPGLSRLVGVFLCLLPICLRYVSGSAFVGFNYGTQLSVAPLAEQVVNLLKIQQITHLRLYDANSSMLRALAGTGIQVVVTVPNNQLLSIGQSNSAAFNWVKNNVIAYIPNTNITGICVGTEVFTAYPNAAPVLVNAMNAVHSALVASQLDSQIKVSTSHSTGIIFDSFPPSQAFFNKSLDTVLEPMLNFLSKTSSYFMLNVYTYDIYQANRGTILLDYALLNPLTSSQIVVDSNTLLQYTNLFDAVLDSAFFAMARLNYTNISVVVAETGWPSKGDTSDTDATADNAATYNSNLIKHIMNTTGTPKFPRTAVNTFILELFNEDARIGSTTIKNYGLFNSSNLMPVYLLPLTGSGPLLANDTTNQLYCVSKPGIDDDELQIALDWVCGPGQADCTSIQPGKLCYEPDTIEAHASYAFNSYFQKNRNYLDSCNFNGVATITTTNPSYGGCIYSARNTSLAINSSTTFANSSFAGNGSSSSAAISNKSNLTYLYVLVTFVSCILVISVTPKF